MGTCLDVVTNALLACRVLDQPGQIPSSEHAEYGRNHLNRIIGQWSSRSLMIWTTKQAQYPLIAGKKSYTIGRAAGADIVADRPQGIGPGGGIRWANIITQANPDVIVAMAIMSDEDWANLALRSFNTSIPPAIYNDGSTPNSTLYLYGTPTNATYKLELWTDSQIPTFAALTDVFQWPPNYEEAATLTLGESLAMAFGVPVGDDLRMSASKARANVTSLNSAPPRLTSDTAGLSRDSKQSDWDYRTGRVI